MSKYYLVLNDMIMRIFKCQDLSAFINGPYFDTQPFVDDQGLDYFENKEYNAKANYCFTQVLTSILTSAITCDFV